MRRLIPITAFALILASPLCAQRGSGHFGGGGHSAFSRSTAGFAAHSGGHFSSSRPAMSHGFAHAQGFARGPYLHDSFHGQRFRGRSHLFGLRNYCYGYPRGFGYRYPWWGYDPWLWDSDSSSYDDDYDQNLAIANDMNQQNLAEQRMLRQEEADGDQDVYAPHQSVTRPQQGSVSDHGDPIVPPTLLVFRDRHTEEIRNYAVVSGTLWSFTGQRTQKIPLAEIDLAATVKANEDRGVTFTVPSTSPGQ